MYVKTFHSSWSKVWAWAQKLCPGVRFRTQTCLLLLAEMRLRMAVMEESRNALLLRRYCLLLRSRCSISRALPRLSTAAWSRHSSDSPVPDTGGGTGDPDRLTTEQSRAAVTEESSMLNWR